MVISPALFTSGETMSGFGFARRARQVLSHPTQSAGTPPAAEAYCAVAGKLMNRTAPSAACAILEYAIVFLLSFFMFNNAICHPACSHLHS
jgi:hypothetical protein